MNKKTSFQNNGDNGLTNLFTGFLLSILAVPFGISIATLVFSSSLSSNLAVGVGIVMISFIVPSLIIAVFSAYRGTIGGPKASLTPALALLASNITAAVAVQEQTFPTVVAAIALSSMMTGIFLYVLGYFKWGNLVRYLPYPVMGGVFAGTGLLLVEGGLSVMIPEGLTLNAFFAPSMIIHWLPGLLFGVFLLWLQRYRNHYLLMPCYLLLWFFLFYCVIAVSGTHLEDARNAHWLLVLNLHDGIWPPLDLEGFQYINWPIIMNQTPTIMIIISIAAISLLLDASGIEVLIKEELNLNKELKVAGMANIASGFAGGIPGVQVLSDTAFAFKLNAKGRVAGISFAFFSILAVIMGPLYLSYFPILILGGLLIYLGGDFLIEWMYEAWFKLSRWDYVTVSIIMISIALWGLLVGVGVGILASVIIFVVNYSQVGVIKHVLSGTSYSSNVERDTVEKKLLKQHGMAIHIFILHGFLFFGSSNNLLRQLSRRIKSPNHPNIQFLLLDFHQVSRLDISTAFNFTRLLQITRKEKITLIVTNLDQQIKSNLEKMKFFEEKDGVRCLHFNEIGLGMEWCENKLLKSVKNPELKSATFLDEYLTQAFDDEQAVRIFIPYLKKIKGNAGNMLFSQGENYGGVFFIESGYVSINLKMDKGKEKKLLSCKAGSIIGEMSLYRLAPRSASAVMDTTCVLYELSFESYQKLQQESPNTAMQFHRYVVRLLSDRLAVANREMAALLYGAHDQNITDDFKGG